MFPFESTATPDTSPKLRSGGSLKKSGTESNWRTGTFCWADNGAASTTHTVSRNVHIATSTVIRRGYDSGMGSAGNRGLWAVARLAIALALSAGIMHAQGLVWNGGYGYTGPPRFPTATTFGKGFNFCRLMFQSNRGEKRRWETDYPGADINFSYRLAELAKTRVRRTDAPCDGSRDHLVVRATDR